MKRFITFLLSVIAVAVMSNAGAQVSELTVPLYIGINTGVTTNFSNKLTTAYNADLSYTFAKRLPVYAIAESRIFVPKDGTTTNYNRATNLGVGLGFIFHTADSKIGSDYLIKATVTHTVGSSPFKHTNYTIGLHSNEYIVKDAALTYGIGYSLFDYTNKATKADHGMYVTIGLRFGNYTYRICNSGRE